MQNIPTKTDGVSTLPAAEFNQIPSELENLITDSGQALSGADLFQASKAVSTYAAGGDFYTDTGVADAYVLSAVGGKKAPTAYFVGMKVRFETANATTGGAATVNVAGLGVKSIKQFDGTTDPIAGSIPANVEVALSYDGTNFAIVSVASAAANIGGGSGTVTNVATGEGVTGGPITTTGTVALDVNGLTENAAIDGANDYIPYYDTSLGGHRKIKPDDLLSGLLSENFVSSEQTITSGGLVTMAHGLTGEPKLIQLNLVCKIAEDNWNVNDVILMSHAGSYSATYNQAIYWDATNIYVRYEDATNAFAFTNKLTGTSALLTNSSWRLIVKAWS